MNIGFEQDGKNERFERPVLVFKKFNKGMFWGIPITSKYKEGKFYFPFNIKKEIMVAILSQLRVLSSKRLIRRLSKMPENKFYKLNLEVIDFYKIKTDPFKGSSSAYGNLYFNYKNKKLFVKIEIYE